ncbi:MAG: sugar ABC transporter permease, partial [Lachnospiraceae bacterium]|nr:sugar ABC transporter permease [Lachnospiraceae bacterium]
MTLKENIKHFFHNTWKHRVHVLMALPTFLIMFFFLYVPMAGLVMAFKDFNYNDGIWGSPWKTPLLGNFTFLTASKDLFVEMTSNTLMYYVIFTLLGTFLNVL